MYNTKSRPKMPFLKLKYFSNSIPKVKSRISDLNVLHFMLDCKNADKLTLGLNFSRIHLTY